jgi:peptide/nickel transport system permease protein
MATAVAEDLKRVSKKKKTVDIGQIPQWRLMVRRFMQSKLSVAGGIILIIMYLMALFADFLVPYKYDDLDSNNQWAAPTHINFVGGGPGVCALKQTLDEKTFTWIYTQDCSTVSPIKFFVHGYPYSLLGFIPTDIHLFGVDAPAKLYLWGADREGRDLFARTLIGSRVSLTVGLVGVAIAVVLGAFLGTVSGYFGGVVDNLMQRTIELIQTFPTLPLWLALAAALPRDLPVVQRFFFISVVLSLVSWTGLARQVRGKVLGYRSADYTAAALSAGSSHTRIITTHMIPNAISHIIVVAALAVPITILGETGLSFLGVGMLPPAVSWGVLLKDAQQVQVVTTYPWLMIPGVMVVIAVLCFNFLGDGLRDAVDPYG